MKTTASPFRTVHRGRGRAMLLGLLFSLTAFASTGKGEAGFTASLDKARLAELKLDRLTDAERGALDAAIQDYVHATLGKVRHEEAVRKLGRARQAPDPELQVQSRVAGPFLGWSGNTVFRLANGQVWRQVGADQYYHPFPEGTEVTIYPVGLGGFRLRLPTGATVAVRRL